MTCEDVRELLRREVRAAGGQTAFSKRHGCDRATLSLILGGGRHSVPPSIMVALGLKKIVTYEKQ